MQYRNDKYGNKISVLGYGCMRFTKNVTGTVMEKTEKEIMTAYEAGVNYYDTAYIYPDSEAALGKILEKNGIRKNISIATKLPHYLMKSKEDAEKCFQEELRRLRTDYVDYYLMHMLSDTKTWDRLTKLGIKDWIEEKKESGQIRQIGFSYHGNSDMFCQLIDAYDWDFCQIQYNYLDEHSQAGRTGLHHAASKGIPVVIMEPLRGGKLVHQLPEKAKRLFVDYKVKRSPAAWAFRWLYHQPEIMCVLSGMNSLDMVNENIKTAESSQIGELTDEEFILYKNVVNAINEKVKVPCTGCRYCMPCPKQVDIPGVFSAYNKKYTEGWFHGMVDYMMCTILRKDITSASNCIQCGKCEIHCPQGIKIREELKNVKKEMEGPVYKLARKIIPLFMKY